MKVLTIGTFDLLHFGHIRFLNECKKLGDLYIGLNTDEFVTTFKDRPVMTYHERKYAIKTCGFGAVWENNSAGKELIEDIKPDFLVVGSDWADRDYYKQIDMTQDELDKLYVKLVYLPRTPGGEYPMSTSEIKRRIREN